MWGAIDIMKSHQKTWKQLGMVGALGGILLLGIALLRRGQQRKKQRALLQHLSFHVEGVSSQIKGLTEEQATARLPATTNPPDQQTEERVFLKKAIFNPDFTLATGTNVTTDAL